MLIINEEKKYRPLLIKSLQSRKNKEASIKNYPFKKTLQCKQTNGMTKES